MTDREEVKARLRAWMKRPMDPAMETTRGFLRSFSDANGMEEIHTAIACLAVLERDVLEESLKAIETVLANPPSDGAVALMVAIDGNRSLDDNSDTGALAYLGELAAMAREALAATTS